MLDWLDVLGWFNLSAYLLREAAILNMMLRESVGSGVRIVISDYGFDIRHFSRTCLPMTSPY